MDEFPLLACVDFKAAMPPTPWDDPSCFVSEIVGTVRVIVDEDGEDIEAGTLKILRIHSSHACNEHVSLLEICDSHSDWLVAMFHTIFTADEETREELDIEGSYNDLIVLWEYDVRPEFRSFVTQAFETAIISFGSTSLVIAAREDERFPFVGLDLTTEEWMELGFIKIAESQFVFRDNACVHPYKRRGPIDDDAA